jgi:N6-L-threonylcarbamoyladenine synthase
MITLGIESTAHTLGLGVMDGKKPLANIIRTYIPPEGEGIHPRKAADHHASEFVPALSSALKAANISMNDVELISFAQGPGIGATLRLGVVMAKYLSASTGIPIIGVNHGYAHAKISEMFSGLERPLYLYVSGGNTQIMQEHEWRMEVLGETLDIGMGNLFDTFARGIGIKRAHGAELSRLAIGGNYVKLPYTVKGLNLAFSGLLTSAQSLAKTHPHKDVAYSMMETAFSMACEACERALFLSGKKSLVVCGGGAQNRRLQGMLASMCAEDGVRFGAAPDEFNRDNGAMIAYAGEILYEKFGTIPIEKWGAIQDFRTDMVQEVVKKRQGR